MIEKFYLHYIGRKLYPKEVFIKEAQNIGVNRCLPLRIIKGLKWGDKILLGLFIPSDIIYCQCEENKESVTQGNICLKCKHFILAKGQKIDNRKNKKDGTAEVFGYFVITGLNYTASEEFKEKLANSLDIVSSNNCNTQVQRQCGNYIIGTSYIVSNTIKEIIEKAEQLNVERNEPIKFFVSGRFYSMTTKFTPINFSRALIPIKFEMPLLPDYDDETLKLGYIYDYKKRSYIKKYAKRGRPKKGN